MAMAQLGSVLGRRLPSDADAAIRGRLPHLTSNYAAREQQKATDAGLALQRQAQEQSAAQGSASLSLAEKQAEEQKRQAKQSEMAGMGQLGLTGALGAAQYGPSIMNAMGMGSTAAPSAVAGALGVPTATAAGGIAEGTATSLALGPGTEVAGAAGLGGAGLLSYAGPAAAGFGGGLLASNIGGGKSTTTRAAKGFVGGALAGAAAGGLPTLGIGAIPGAIIGGIAGAIGGGSSGDSVICTLLAETGELDRELYQAEAEWSMGHKSPATIRGYHWWAVPLTGYMRERAWLRKLSARVVVPLAEYLAYRAGARPFNGNWFGAAVDLMGSAGCWCIGQFVTNDALDPRWDKGAYHA